MVATKAGACLESDPARNQSGFDLLAHKWRVIIIKYSDDIHVQIFLFKN